MKKMKHGATQHIWHWAGVMACEATEEQPLWKGSVASRSYKQRNR